MHTWNRSGLSVGTEGGGGSLDGSEQLWCAQPHARAFPNPVVRPLARSGRLEGNAVFALLPRAGQPSGFGQQNLGTTNH